ncbi:MAG: hypothetical protein FJ333_10740, partial [Sphingomonadales bacterium]|nr:hypothetical protein [Sphingomonadales bacterium]
TVINEITLAERGHVIVLDSLIGASKAIVANVYAPCRDQGNNQLNFFKSLDEVIQNLINAYGDCTLVIMGDLNFDLTIDNSKIKKYKKVKELLLDMCEKYRLTFQCEDVTYQNRGTNAFSKIDYVMMKLDDQVKQVQSIDWTFTKSDHGAIKVNLFLPQRKRMVKAPRISPEWLTNGELVKDVKEVLKEELLKIPTEWNSHLKYEYAKVLLRGLLQDRIKMLRKGWNEEIVSVGQLIKSLVNKGKMLDELERQQLDSAMATREAIMETKALWLANKTKLTYYNEGEKGTKSFLGSLKKQSNKNDMDKLRVNGNIITGNKVEEEVVSFYNALYNQNTKTKSDNSKFLSKVIKCTNMEDAALSAKVTKQELWSTLATCKDSAPGPDGFPYSIYKTFWNEIGQLLTDSLNYSLAEGAFPTSQKQSYLKLLPKEGKDKLELKNWRPITLSNCDFKILTKTLSNRLLGIVSDKLSSCQTAYIKGRQIQDNIRLARIACKKTDGYMVMLDAQKAFDSLSHKYITEVLKAHGLYKFVKIFETLYKDQSVNILLNDDVCGSYKIGNGVKQGDSLS